MYEGQKTMRDLEKRETTKMGREVKDNTFLLIFKFKVGEVKPKENRLQVTGRGGREVGAQED